MGHSINGQLQGLTVSVSGYSDKLNVLLETILKEMRAFTVNPERFAIQKEQVREFFHQSYICFADMASDGEQLRQEWQNALLDQPCYLSEVRAAQIVRERYWGEQDKLDELQCKLASFTLGLGSYSKIVLINPILPPSKSCHRGGTSKPHFEYSLANLHRGARTWERHEGCECTI